MNPDGQEAAWPVSAAAPAKINLSLRVGPPRADGYHPIASLMAFADVGDTVAAAGCGPGDRTEGIVGDFLIEGPLASSLGAGPPAENFVCRAAAALADELLAAGRPRPGPVRLRLTKRLPAAAGLGGGTSDGAATLRALAQLWSLGEDEKRVLLPAAARRLGADGPACLASRPLWATGLGDHIAPAAMPELFIVIAHPGPGASTAAVYRRYDERGAFFDVAQASPPPSADAAAFGEWLAQQGNDLTQAAIDVCPPIAEVLAALRAAAGAPARLSGSGSAAFAIVADADAAEQAASDVRRLQPSWWVASARLAAGVCDD